MIIKYKHYGKAIALKVQTTDKFEPSMVVFFKRIGLDPKEINIYRWIYGDNAINSSATIGEVMNFDEDGDTIYVKWFSLSG